MSEANITTVEIWRPIPSTAGVYEASTLGRIRSVDRYRPALLGRMYLRKSCILKADIRRKGYAEVCLQIDRKGKRHFVHTIVAEAFHGPKPNGLQVNHSNGLKADNRPENLEYMTVQQNLTHAYTVLGHFHKLTMQQATQIRALEKSGRSRRSIAKEFGVSASHVWAIWKRRCHNWDQLSPA